MIVMIDNRVARSAARPVLDTGSSQLEARS